MSWLRDIAFPVFVSLALHAGLVSFLFWNWEGKTKPKPAIMPRHVEAKLVELKPKTKTVAKAPEKPRKVDLTAQKRELERQRQAAEQKRQAEIKRKQAEARKKADEQKKAEAQKRAEAEKKRQQELKAAEAEKLERMRKEEEQRLRQEQEFQQALLEEQGLLMEDTYATEAQSYVSLISRRIEQNWSRPPSARSGMQCELLIKLVPTGQVVSADVVKSSGNAAFDRSAIQAVKKVDRFPEIQEMPLEVFERYYRELRLVFNPQDLRQ